jgi:hypothetical protein
MSHPIQSRNSEQRLDQIAPQNKEKMSRNLDSYTNSNDINRKPCIAD